MTIRNLIGLLLLLFLTGCGPSDDNEPSKSSPSESEAKHVATASTESMTLRVSPELRDYLKFLISKTLDSNISGYVNLDASMSDEDVTSKLASAAQSTGYRIRWPIEIISSPPGTNISAAKFQGKKKSFYAAILDKYVDTSFNPGDDVDLICLQSAKVRDQYVLKFCIETSVFQQHALNQVSDQIIEELIQKRVRTSYADKINKALRLEKQGADVLRCRIMRDDSPSCDKIPGSGEPKGELDRNGIKEINDKPFNIASSFSFETMPLYASKPITEREKSIAKFWYMNDLKISIENKLQSKEQREELVELMSSFDIDAVNTQSVERDYEENEFAADRKYKGKTLLINGTIDSINSGINDEPYVVFKSKRIFNGLQAKFSKSASPEKISALRKGKLLTLVCLGDGEIMGTPMLRDCEFEEKVLPLLIDSRIERDIHQLTNSPESVSYYVMALYALSRGMAPLQPADSICFSAPYSAECEKAKVSIDYDSKADSLPMRTALMENIVFGIGQD